MGDGFDIANFKSAHDQTLQYSRQLQRLKKSGKETKISDLRGSPVWIGDKRIAAVSGSSIDRSTVDLNRGEMSFPLFKFTGLMDDVCDENVNGEEKMMKLAGLVGDEGFPSYLQKYIKSVKPSGAASIAIHRSSDISGYKDANTNVKQITRKKGFFGKSQMEVAKFPKAVHHLKVFRNRTGDARLFYKFEGSLQFLKNDK